MQVANNIIKPFMVASFPNVINHKIVTYVDKIG